MERVARAETVNRGFETLVKKATDADAEQFVRLTADYFAQGMAMTTSFGIHSAVTLHLVTRILPDIPVIWIDTGYLFPETYRFAEQMTKHLNLNLKVYQSSQSPARMEALYGRLWDQDNRAALDRYDFIRKVEPLQRAFKDLAVKSWFTGLRAQQTDYRQQLDRIHWMNSRCRLLPVLRWTREEVENYLEQHALPPHPLRKRGYLSIGDWHSSRPALPADKSERESRFRGIKQECGIHLPLTPEAEESLRSSGL